MTHASAPPSAYPRSCAVFCGSRTGTKPQFAHDAALIGAGLAERGIKLVYGGGASGLMGIVADASVKAGGDTHGAMPAFLRDAEGLPDGVRTMEITDGLMERKMRLYELADAYVVLPGGIGTLDEFSDILVAAQLERERKAIHLVNTLGWADRLLAFFAELKELQFVGAPLADFFITCADAADFLKRLDARKRA